MFNAAATISSLLALPVPLLWNHYYPHTNILQHFPSETGPPHPSLCSSYCIVSLLLFILPKLLTTALRALRNLIIAYFSNLMFLFPSSLILFSIYANHTFIPLTSLTPLLVNKVIKHISFVVLNIGCSLVVLEDFLLLDFTILFCPEFPPISVATPPQFPSPASPPLLLLTSLLWSTPELSHISSSSRFIP